MINMKTHLTLFEMPEQIFVAFPRGDDGQYDERLILITRELAMSLYWNWLVNK